MKSFCILISFLYLWHQNLCYPHTVNAFAPNHIHQYFLRNSNPFFKNVDLFNKIKFNKTSKCFGVYFILLNVLVYMIILYNSILCSYSKYKVTHRLILFCNPYYKFSSQIINKSIYFIWIIMDIWIWLNNVYMIILCSFTILYL